MANNQTIADNVNKVKTLESSEVPEETSIS
jgi:hypothetical protein